MARGAGEDAGRQAMIDDEDVEIAVVGLDGGGTVVGTVVVLLVVAFLAWRASVNDEDCSKHRCAHGAPKLMQGECICIEKAAQ